MNWLEEMVTDNYTEYMVRNSRVVSKVCMKLEKGSGEILIQTLIGRLALKLPSLKLSLPAYEMQKAAYILSALIVQEQVDNGLWKTRSEVKSHYENGIKKYRKDTYVLFEGSPEKDLLKGLSFKPVKRVQTKVAGGSLSSFHKQRLKALGKIPFKVWSGCSKEILMKGYSLKKDWNRAKDSKGRSVSEDPSLKQRRLSSYADIIVDELKSRPLYLQTEYQSAGRIQYLLQLEGIRPQGKLWETLMLDSYKPVQHNSKELKHVIYCLINGTKVPRDQVVWDESYLKQIKDMDEFKAETEDEFGEILMLKKLRKSLIRTRKGKKDYALYGTDLTNSGLIMAGVSFRSQEMMMAGNVFTSFDGVQDSHTAFGKGLGLDISRKEVKKLHMPLLHGASFEGLTQKLKEMGVCLTPDELMERMKGSYGESVANIPSIADWGSLAISNKLPKLTWKTREGFPASFEAKMEHVPFTVTVPSSSEEKGFKTYKMVGTFPLREDSKGRPIFSSEDGVNVRKRGLYANITHSMDAGILHKIVDTCLDEGIPIICKHDDYIVPTSFYGRLVEIIQKELMKLNTQDEYMRVMKSIKEHFNIPLDLPELQYGDCTVVDGDNFLMP